MKILNVNVSLDPVYGGGTAERTLQISRAFAAAGHVCTILTTDVGITPDFRSKLKEFKVIELPCFYKRFYLFRFSFSKLRDVVNQSDIIHLIGHWSFINALVYFLARRYNKTYAVCPSGALPLYGRSKLIKKIYNVLVGRAIIRNAHFHVAVAENEVAHFAEYGIQAGQITLIPNGVNLDDFAIDKGTDFFEHFGLDNTPYILFMGRLNIIKGPDLLLRAFLRISDRFPDVNLVLAGPDGGMLQTLKGLILSQEIEKRIHFVGHLDGKTKIAAYSSALMLVVPSRQEAMSIVALESGVCSVPVLMTDQCGFGNLPEIGGGMVVPATEEGLSEGLRCMLENRSELRKMGTCFKLHIINKLTWQVAASSYINLFKRVETNFVY